MSHAALPEMPCAELVERVTDYLEGAISPEDRVRLEAHLRECVACGAYLAQLRDTLRLTGELRESHLDPAVRAELSAVFARWRAGPVTRDAGRGLLHDEP